MPSRPLDLLRALALSAVAAGLPTLTAAETPGIVSGGIYKLTCTGSGKCLEVSGGSTSAGASCVQFTDNGSTAERWKVEYQNDNCYKLTAQVSGKVLEVAGGGTTNGLNIQQGNDQGSDAQRWMILPDPYGYALVNKHSCLKLEVANHSLSDNGNLDQWDESNIYQNQSWSLSLVTLPAVTEQAAIIPGAIYKLTARHSGKCLDVASSSTSAGAKVQQYTDNGTKAQQWKFEVESGNSYKLTAQCSGKVLDVAGGSLANGASVQQGNDLNTDEERWRLVDKGNGYFTLVNQHSGKVLDVTGAATGNSVAVEQWTDNGGTNQQWKPTLVSDPTAATVTLVPEHGYSYAGGLPLSTTAYLSDTDHTLFPVDVTRTGYLAGPLAVRIYYQTPGFLPAYRGGDYNILHPGLHEAAYYMIIPAGTATYTFQIQTIQHIWVPGYSGPGSGTLSTRMYPITYAGCGYSTVDNDTFTLDIIFKYLGYPSGTG